ncbi:MAG: hypothetical protein ABIH19_04180, partial [Candidatus Omnitrophota bacterium]
LLPIMEKAIHITSLRNLKYFKEGAFQRIYWGQEFCQNLFPTLSDTDKIIEFSKKKGLGFTLVTPFVTEQGLAKVIKILKWLKRKHVIKAEIVINDWGVLEFIHSELKGIFGLSLGRLLVRQERDPSMKIIIEKQKPFGLKSKDGKIKVFMHRVPSREYCKGIKGSYINSVSVQHFLSDYGIKRVELNNVIQGMEIQSVKLEKTVYTPFVNISTTRFCPMKTKLQKIFRIGFCRKECQRYYEVLRNQLIPKFIYKRGNTTFYKNSLKPSLLNKSGIDRIVFQPELPF